MSNATSPLPQASCKLGSEFSHEFQRTCLFIGTDPIPTPAGDTTAGLDVFLETVLLVVAEEKDTTADLDVVTEKAVVVRMSDCLSVILPVCVHSVQCCVYSVLRGKQV